LPQVIELLVLLRWLIELLMETTEASPSL